MTSDLINALPKLQPQTLWFYFQQLTQIPRPSKKEAKIQRFITEFADRHALESYQDNVGNIIIRKPATLGMEHCQGVILQAHLDMVGQVNSNTVHNFATDPIEVLAV